MTWWNWNDVVTPRAWLGVAGALLALAAKAQSSSPPSSPAPGPVATIDTGILRGATASQVHRFLGIPYAKAPVGALRWKAPQPAEPWQGERAATALGAPCPQIPVFTRLPGPPSEDCLFLNVYAPARPGDPAARPLPVMVWIHGGSFTEGNADHDASLLAAKANVVVVTLNYRLGALGLLALPQFRDEEPALNFGIQDQQAALKWVQRNIASFRGDARNVTLFGQSAGGGSTCVQMASPRTRGLFHRAIVQSAACTRPTGVTLTLEQAYAGGQALALKAGCPPGPGQVACMRGKTPDEILAASPPTVDFSGAPPSWGFTNDGQVLTGDFARQLAAGTFQRVPVMIGATRNEASLALTMAFDVQNGHPMTVQEYEAALSGAAGDAGKLIAQVYSPKAYGTPLKAMIAFMGDYMLACPTHQLTRALSRHTRVFAYQFDDPKAPHGLPLPLNELGAFHGAELQYLFDLPTRALFDAGQTALSDQMIAYWGNFATTGDPNGKGADGQVLPRWPRFDTLTTPYRALKPGGAAGTLAWGAYQNEHRCLFWGLVDGLSALAGPPAAAATPGQR